MRGREEAERLYESSRAVNKGWRFTARTKLSTFGHRETRGRFGPFSGPPGAGLRDDPERQTGARKRGRGSRVVVITMMMTMMMMENMMMMMEKIMMMIMVLDEQNIWRDAGNDDYDGDNNDDEE